MVIQYQIVTLAAASLDDLKKSLESPVMTASTRLPKFISHLLGAAVLATFAVGAQAATSLTISDATSRALSGTLTFNNGTPGVHTESGMLGSYKLGTDWVYCLSPYTNAPYTASYDKITLGQFLATGGGFDQQFSSPAYQTLTPGYTKQNNTFVLNKIVELYNWAYQDSTTGNVQEKSAGFAFALWEIEGETTAGWGSAVGDLTLGGGAITAAAKAYADTLLGALKIGTTAAWNTAGFSTLTTYQFDVWQASPLASSQSFLTVSTSPNNRTGVPEPTTGLLVAAGALAFIGSRRVSRRAAKAA
jgi:hypothetical protein